MYLRVNTVKLSPDDVNFRGGKTQPLFSPPYVRSKHAPLDTSVLDARVEAIAVLAEVFKLLDMLQAEDSTWTIRGADREEPITFRPIDPPPRDVRRRSLHSPY